MKKNTTSPATGNAAADDDADGFTDEERSAMKERAQELRKVARRGTRGPKADPEVEVLAKIAEMAEADRVLAERVHALVKSEAPHLVPRLWYGMPAYSKDGKVLCFFQSGQKFKTRYATLGFSDQAALDDGNVWATSYALTELTAADEARVGELIRRAAA
ncbi:iron chaperone [Streptomyces avicenniae]|uniref:iron chaperone n=1 Tax=Streptomyces avicenniae TaxID=500153 RepID=UPI00069BDC58|nr:DUF1801 domain-containing protein [Streptomyces avicenniae]